jgi:arylesterase/paraoxonase
MFRNIATIFIAIFAIFIAVSFNHFYEFYTVLGINKPSIKPYENGKCRKIEGE